METEACKGPLVRYPVTEQHLPIVLDSFRGLISVSMPIHHHYSSLPTHCSIYHQDMQLCFNERGVFSAFRTLLDLFSLVFLTIATDRSASYNLAGPASRVWHLHCSGTHPCAHHCGKSLFPLFAHEAIMHENITPACSREYQDRPTLTMSFVSFMNEWL